MEWQATRSAQRPRADRRHRYRLELRAPRRVRRCRALADAAVQREGAVRSRPLRRVDRQLGAGSRRARHSGALRASRPSLDVLGVKNVARHRNRSRARGEERRGVHRAAEKQAAGVQNRGAVGREGSPARRPGHHDGLRRCRRHRRRSRRRQSRADRPRGRTPEGCRDPAARRSAPDRYDRQQARDAPSMSSTTRIAQRAVARRKGKGRAVLRGRRHVALARQAAHGEDRTIRCA